VSATRGAVFAATALIGALGSVGVKTASAGNRTSASLLAAPGPPLGFETRVEPVVAFVGQPVEVVLRWTHAPRRGASPLRINRRGLLTVEIILELFDPRGRKVPFDILIAVPPLRDQDFQSLAPGESFEYRYNLATLAAVQPFAPGTYTVRARYRSDPPPEGVTPGWLGELKAPQVRFQVRPEEPPAASTGTVSVPTPSR